MSMMQILGAFAKNLLEENDISRQETFQNKEDDERNYQYVRVVHNPDCYYNVMKRRKKPPYAATKKKQRNEPDSYGLDVEQSKLLVKEQALKQQDINRIANKVTNSIAAHIDRMVKRRQQMYGSVFRPYASEQFQKVWRNGKASQSSNPFWNHNRASRPMISQKKLQRRHSCKGSVRTGSPSTKKVKEKLKSETNKTLGSSSTKKLDKVTTKTKGNVTTKTLGSVKIKRPKKEKEKKDKIKKKKKQVTPDVVCINRPIEKESSQNIVVNPKTVWAEELLDEFKAKQAIVEKQKMSELFKEKPQIQKPVDKRHCSCTMPSNIISKKKSVEK